jgi:hypothetical protein
LKKTRGRFQARHVGFKFRSPLSRYGRRDCGLHILYPLGGFGTDACDDNDAPGRTAAHRLLVRAEVRGAEAGMILSLRSDFNSDLRATSACTLRTRVASILGGNHSGLNRCDLFGFSVTSNGDNDLPYCEAHT